MTFVSIPARSVFGAAAALILGGACLVGAAGPAAAAQPDSEARIVFVGDLNLASPSGQAAYAARIKSAAEAVCATGMKDVAAQAAESRCVKAAVGNVRTVTEVTAS